jgi:hypothetical protein
MCSVAISDFVVLSLEFFHRGWWFLVYGRLSCRRCVSSCHSAILRTYSAEFLINLHLSEVLWLAAAPPLVMVSYWGVGWGTVILVFSLPEVLAVCPPIVLLILCLQWSVVACCSSVCSRVVSLFLVSLLPCPWLVIWEVFVCVFWVSFLQFFCYLCEFWAELIP